MKAICEFVMVDFQQAEISAIAENALELFKFDWFLDLLNTNQI